MCAGACSRLDLIAWSPTYCDFCILIVFTIRSSGSISKKLHTLIKLFMMYFSFIMQMVIQVVSKSLDHFFVSLRLGLFLCRRQLIPVLVLGIDL